MPKGLLEAVAKMGIDMKSFTETVFSSEINGTGTCFPNENKKTPLVSKWCQRPLIFFQTKNPPLQ